MTNPHNIYLLETVLVQQQCGFVLLKFSILYLNFSDIGDDV